MEKNYDTSTGDLNILAAKVLKFYDITPEDITIIQGGSIKTVWKVKDRSEFLCLKRLKQSYDKALFSVNAQIFIKNSGGKVPGILISNSGEPIIQFEDQLFVLYEWIDGTSLDFNNNSDLLPSLQGLASFHIASKGYSPPDGSKVSSKIGKWPDQYNSMKNRMLEWKELSKKSSSTPSFSSYLECIDQIIDLCDLALYMLEESDYRSLSSKGSNSIVLCHQDFGKGNALLTDNGVFVLDLDGVTFDLPCRDLRKIIGKKAENKNLWDINSINTVLADYNSINPLSDNEMKILYIDLIFPHWFFGLIKNMYQSGKMLKVSEIEKAASLEQSKLAVLNAVLNRGE